ncbi:LacI family DNA-binding transcriptional regulator [Kiritimatiellaeota bacterium B1221]|nr:LacI family DNA-binding transcriptional regulator [Kiritimatiellaeota bacterium B1221]
MQKPSARPSLKNIAEEANVSVSLVSKVLNDRLGNTGVTEVIAEKIRTTAKELGYRKNLSAESLRTGRHNAIGVLIHRHGESGSGLTGNIVLGITEAAREHNQKLILNFFERDDEFIEMSETAHRGMMDGLIIGGALHPDLKNHIFSIQKQGLPVVTIFDQPIHPKIVNVGMDQKLAQEMATLHLLDQGCKSVGTLSTHPERTRGYQKAMKDRGIPIHPNWIQDTGALRYTYQAGEAAVKNWLSSDTLPDGIAAQSDAHAMGIINSLHAGGVKVPEQVKVTGFDNSAFCEYVRPTITSVSQVHEQRGKRTMEMVLDLSKGKNAVHEEVQPELILRGSSRSPKD